MKVYFNIFGRQIPSYGFLILIGGALANLIAMCILKKKKLDINDFILMEAYGVLGGYLGAKILYMLIEYKNIDWHRIMDGEYFSQIMKAGFVFYGGIILGVLAVVLCGKIHKIAYMAYLRELIFLVPFAHAFGRIGCFMCGCCYGVPYDGWACVVFPENSFAIPGIKMFPVQIVEAVFLFLLSFALVYWRYVKKSEYVVEIYFFLYGGLRFVLEHFRADEARGKFWMFSTSQWISIMMVLIAIAVVSARKYKKMINVVDKPKAR